MHKKKFFFSIILNILLMFIVVYQFARKTTVIDNTFIHNHHWKYNSADVSDYCPQFGDVFYYVTLDGNLIYDKNAELVGVIKARRHSFLIAKYQLFNYAKSLDIYDMVYKKQCSYIAKSKK